MTGANGLESPKRKPPEAMPGGTYVIALLDCIPTILGASAKPLDHEGLKGPALYDFIARHNSMVSFAFISWLVGFAFSLN